MVHTLSSSDNALRPCHVLVVDGNAQERTVINSVLKGRGLDSICASQMHSLRDIVRNPNCEEFDCAFIAEDINGKPGLECAAWLMLHDPHLSCILLVRELTPDTLISAIRIGIADVLSTPVDAPTISRSLERALYLARGRRGLLNITVQARDATKLQRRVVTDNATLPRHFAPYESIRVESSFFPALEAGGDFIRSFPLDDNRLLIISGDVSGHDLSSGFISAYFLGMIRGMLQEGSEPGKIFQHFHGILIREWNRKQEKYDIIASVSAAYTILDFKERTILCCCNGTPLPYLCDEHLNMTCIGENAPPLGWFTDTRMKSTLTPMPDVGSIVLFSDGVLDLSHEDRLCPMSKADIILGIPAEEGRTSSFLREQRDDIFVHRISWCRGRMGREHFIRPICDGCCTCDGDDAIDKCQERWGRAIMRALPGLSKTRRMEILLCCREAALNAIEHGSPTNTCRISMACRGSHRLCISVRAQNWDGKARNPHKRQGHIPFGMKIIHGYSNKSRYDEFNNTLEMEFLLSRPQDDVCTFSPNPQPN